MARLPVAKPRWRSFFDLNAHTIYMVFVLMLGGLVVMSQVDIPATVLSRTGNSVRNTNFTFYHDPSAFTTVVWHNPKHGEANSQWDVHDGTIVQWQPGGKFYWYGMAYTDCPIINHFTLLGTFSKVFNFLITKFVDNFDCAPIVLPGFGNDCQFLTPADGQTVHIYSSDNLHTWKFEGPAFDSYPQIGDHDVEKDSIFFRPAVIYNDVTDTYVMWVNRIPRGSSVEVGYHDGGYITAHSKSVLGPFTILDKQPKMHYRGGGDFAIVADGADAWIAYGSWYNAPDHKPSMWQSSLEQIGMGDAGIHGHAIAVEKLSDDFLDISDGAVNHATGSGNEAPVMFKRGRFFYLMYGTLCCFCKNGGDAKIKVSTNPMGNWTLVNNINPWDHDSHIPAQNSAVIQVRTGNYTGMDKDDVFVWYGDLWQSGRKGTKASENHHRAVMEFVDQQVEIDGIVQSVPVPQRLSNERWTVIPDVWLPEPSIKLEESCKISEHPDALLSSCVF